MKICSCCRGTGGPVEVTCENCAGTGYDPSEDNPFAQCHSCYGEGITDEDICPKCGGAVEMDDDELEEGFDLEEGSSELEFDD